MVYLSRFRVCGMREAKSCGFKNTRRSINANTLWGFSLVKAGRYCVSQRLFLTL